MKIRAFVFSFSVLTATAFAQLGGAVGTVTHGAGSVGRGGAGVGVDHTLNGTVGAGRNTIGGDLAGSAEGAVNTGDTADRASKKSKDVAGKTKDKTKQKGVESKDKAQDLLGDTKAKSQATMTDAKAKSETVAQKSKDEVERPVSADSTSSATSSTDAKKSDGQSSAGSSLNVNTNANVNAAGATVNASSDTQANGSAQAEQKSENGEANANSGDDKLKGLDRAESRVKNATAKDRLELNEVRSDSRTESETHAKAKKSPRKK